MDVRLIKLFNVISRSSVLVEEQLFGNVRFTLQTRLKHYDINAMVYLDDIEAT